MGRAFCTFTAMTISILLRLIPDVLAVGEIAGQAVSIATGDEKVFRNLEELLDFVNRCGTGLGGPAWDSPRLDMH